MKKILILFLVLSLSGCIYVRQNYNTPLLEEITTRMSMDEVRDKIGSPAETQTVEINDKEYEAWRYPIEEKFVGRYNAVPRSYYEILFLDGEVSRWDKVKVVSQPTYDYDEPDPAGKVLNTLEIFKTRSGEPQE